MGNAKMKFHLFVIPQDDEVEIGTSCIAGQKAR
jgi:hypothetical protein